jgi:hypothetical protein
VAGVAIPEPQIQNPIPIDVCTGKVIPISWDDKGARTIPVGVTDSFIAIEMRRIRTGRKGLRFFQDCLPENLRVGSNWIGTRPVNIPGLKVPRATESGRKAQKSRASCVFGAVPEVLTFFLPRSRSGTAQASA